MVEIIIGSAIIVAAILAIDSAYNTYFQYALLNQRNAEVAYLLEEELETVSFLRDTSWTTKIAALSTSTTYYLSWASGTWSATATPQYVDGLFLRSFNISDVKRNGSDDISASGTYDPNTKLITASVSYTAGQSTTTKTMSSYIANFYDN